MRCARGGWERGGARTLPRGLLLGLPLRLPLLSDGDLEDCLARELLAPLARLHLVHAHQLELETEGRAPSLARLLLRLTLALLRL